MEDALARLRRSCGAVTVVAGEAREREPLGVDFRILGPVEVRAQGRPIAVAGGRQRALLALLLLRAGEPVSRDSLIAGLWGERPPDGAVKTVQAGFSRPRPAPGGEAAPLLSGTSRYPLRGEPG